MTPAESLDLGRLQRRLTHLRQWLDRQMDDTARDFESILRDVQSRLDDILMNMPPPAARNKTLPVQRAGCPGAVWERLAACSAVAFGVPVQDVLGQSRKLRASAARHVAWHLLRRNLGLTQMELARLCGRGHSTVSLGEARARHLIAADRRTAVLVAQIEAEVFGRAP